MSILGVEAAANQLGLSVARVRQLAAAGALPAIKVGRAWAFDSGDIEAFPAQHRVAGRPMSPAVAWAVLWARDGRAIEGLAPYAVSRARRYARRDLDDLWPRLGQRAHLKALFVHPSRLDELPGDDRLVAAGVSGADHHGVGLLVPGEVEAYVRHGDLNDVVAEFGLIDAAGEPNVFLRVVGDAVWPFDDVRVAPRCVVAVDLLERSRGPDRLRAAARELDA